MKSILLTLLTTSVFAADFALPVSSGNSGNAAPFLYNSMRYQQVYGASGFSTLTPVGGGWITAIQFRHESGSFTPGFYSGNIELRFSITSQTVDGLSATFSDNIGLNEQIAFNGSVDFAAGANGPLGTAHPYIPLATPYLYNPAAGNLLIDVRMFSAPRSDPVNPVDFDASNLPSDLSSRVYAFDRDGLVGTADTTALITGFRITPVPEPSSIALIVAALVTAFAFGLHKNHPNRKD